MNDTYKAFHEYFEIVEVDSAELLKEVYHLRYRVLCVEGRLPGFDAKLYPNELENDEYDRHSSHILLRHRASDSFVGTTRIIMQDPLNPKKPFPIESHAQIDSDLLDIANLSRRHIAEISRFVILGQFFGRRNKRSNRKNLSSSKSKEIKDRRRFPNVCLALAVGVVHLCAVHNIHHWLSVMDPMLNRLLKYYGLGLNPVGPITNYHGMRRPYYIRLKDVLDNLFLNHREIWELVTDYGKVCPYPIPQVQPAHTYGDKLNHHAPNMLVHT